MKLSEKIEPIKKAELLKNKKAVRILSVVLAVVLVFTAVFGIIGAVTRGEKINCKKEAESYNNSKPDTSYLFVGATSQELSAEITKLDSLLAEAIATVNIDTILYTDETASILGKLLGESSGKSFTDVSFSKLKKDYPDAHTMLNDMQLSSASWEHIGTIPFGITAGDKDAFIKACGAFGKFLGDDMLTLILKAPSAYNDALVPALEALHTGAMPSLTGFVFETGLSGSKRVEFLIEKVLTMIDPVKEAPLTYLCGMLPDFIVNYKRACAFINERDLGLKLPEIESILDSVWSLLSMTYEPIDLDALSKLGTASVAESGGNRGKRVEIQGDRDAIFFYIADYITGHFTYENNYTSIENIFTHTLKEIDPDSEIGKLMTSDLMNRTVACLMNILAKNSPKSDNTDPSVLVENHNAQDKDFTAVFEGFMGRESVASIISSLDSAATEFMASNSLENMIFTDSVATMVSKLTAELCDIELKDISFAALKRSFPEAYSYISTLQAEGKVWEDVDIIPFGITAGDKDMFIKACGAGAEHFGDVLALNIMLAPTAYDEALVPLLEAFHTGPMPSLEEFIGKQGLDSARRMELITEKVLTILEPVKQGPVSYILGILPDLINGYNTASTCSANNPDMALTGLNLPPLNEFLSELLASTGIVLPEYDFNEIVRLSDAVVAQSGDRTGKRMELNGDKEAIFAALAGYILNVISYENNTDAISTFSSELLGINASVIKGILSTVMLLIK